MTELIVVEITHRCGHSARMSLYPGTEDGIECWERTDCLACRRANQNLDDAYSTRRPNRSAWRVAR